MPCYVNTSVFLAVLFIRTEKSLRWIAISFAALVLTACGGGGSEPSESGSTSINPITYSIQVTNSPVESKVRIGQKAEASMSWQFASSGNTSSTGYSVSSLTAGVVITDRRGNSRPSVVITNELSFECETIETIEAQLIVTVGNATQRVTWPINCTGQRIVVEPIESSFGSVGVATRSSLIWRYQSVGEDPQALEYAVTSGAESLEIDPRDGSSLPDTDIELVLRYVCEQVGAVDVELTVTVGTATETLVWELVCTEESVVVEMPPAPATASIGENAPGEITWVFQSTGAEPREISYTVVTSEAGLTIVDGTGSSLPDTAITQRLSYQCETAGLLEVKLAITVGSAHYSVTWSVECTRESVVVEHYPEFVSVSIGEMAKSEFHWRVTTTSEEPRSFRYLIRAEHAALRVGTGEGQIVPGEMATTNIEFLCVDAVQMAILISIDVGSEDYVLVWSFECTEESIDVAVNPLPMSVVAVGEVASTELRWALDTTAMVQREFVYSVSTSVPNLQIGNGTGTTAPGTTLIHDITYACDVEQQIDVVLRITVGLKQTDVSWQVVCAQDSILIVSVPSTQRVPIGETASSEVSWEFQSSYSDRQVSYRLQSRTAAVKIDPIEGIASVGDVVSSNVQFTCDSRGSVSIAIRILVGNESRNVRWQIDCIGEDLTRFVAKFYQGPEIATAEFEARQDLWSYSLILQTGSVEPLRFRTNRQLFLEIRTEHDQQPPLPLQVQFAIDSRIYAISQVGETETNFNSVESGLRYSSKFLFDVPSEVFSTLGEIRVQIDPESRYPELQENNNTVVFALDASNTVLLPPMSLTFVPIRTQDGVPDLSNIEQYTRPIYEQLPVGEIDVSLSTELDASDLSWSPETGRQFLDRLYEFYLIHGDRYTYFQGVVRQPRNQNRQVILCGNAFLGSNVSITGEITEECSDNTGAHEIGHDFNLRHAPACGAEFANPDLDFPYPAGNIGRESGWLMKQRQFVDGTERSRYVNQEYRYYDVMSYCPETFVTRYSYGKALADVNRNFGIQAASPVEHPIFNDFGWVRDQSVVITGSVSKELRWDIRNVVLTGFEAHRFYPEATDVSVQVIHTPSGTILHREFARTLSAAHGENDAVIWGVRIPYFDTDDLQLVVRDRLNRIVLEHDLTATLKQLVH